jgi:hypothetical protein
MSDDDIIKQPAGKQTPVQSANAVIAEVDALERSFKRVINRCYDALAPGKSQADRDKLREALKELINA